MQYNFKGIYDVITPYVKKDVVSYQPTPSDPVKYYFCLTDNTGQLPIVNSDSIFWAVINSLSNFPNSVDTFLTHRPIQASDKVNIQRYQTLMLQTTLSPSEQDELATLSQNLRDKLITPEDFNALQSSIENLQLFFKDNVEAFIVNKQIEFQNEINKFNDKGIYNPSTQYYTKNFVHHNQEVYIALKNNLGITPSDDGVNWRKLSVKGDKGDKGNDGVNLVYQKTFNPTLNYTVNDVVTYNGSAYACILDTPIGKYPDGIDGATYWTLFVSGGGGIGDLNSLTTDNKDNLVNAVNEVNGKVGQNVTNLSNHESALDPHSQYALDSDLSNLAGAGRTNQTVKGNADAIASLQQTQATHEADNVQHITSTERTSWNSKAAGNHNHSGVYEPALAVERKRKITFGVANPSGGVDGDIYFQYE